jgi:hypothetical protein
MHTPMQASPWYQVMCATLNVLNLVDTRNFNRLFSAAPYILACVLFTQAPYILAYGVSFAAKAYGEATWHQGLCL